MATHLRPLKYRTELLLVVAFLVAVSMTVSIKTSGPDTSVPVTPPGLTAWSSFDPVSIACPNLGSCVIVGVNSRDDTSDPEALQEVRGGQWESVTAFEGLPDGSSVGEVGCSGVGDCMADGFNQYLGTPFFTVERNGVWGRVRYLPQDDSPPSYLAHLPTPIECQSSGECWTTVQMSTGSPTTGGLSRDYVVGEDRGKWLKPVSLAESLHSRYVMATAISCWGKSSCTATGIVLSHMDSEHQFTQSERRGVWLAPRLTPTGVWNAAGANFDSLDNPFVAPFFCSSLGNCLLAGYYRSPNGDPIGAADQEIDGQWRHIQVGIGLTASALGSPVEGLACGRPNMCVVSGDTATPDDQGALFFEADLKDHWQKPLLVGSGTDALINQSTCPAPNLCSVVGRVIIGPDTAYGVVMTFDRSHWLRENFDALSELAGVRPIFDAESCVGSTCEILGDDGPWTFVYRYSLTAH
jgi:hypothetical protein